MEDDLRKDVLEGQRALWDESFLEDEDMFGIKESFSARRAAASFGKSGAKRILELGSGQGRDALFFAGAGFDVTATDYSDAGLAALSRRAAKAGATERLRIVALDVRFPLPFEDEVFDAVYSHMLFCMALTLKELRFLCSEIRRVLKPGGKSVYTARHKGDAHWMQGVHRGEEMYELDGYVVRFFDRRTVDLLAEGFSVVEVSEFEEGELPRKLFYVEEKRASLPDEE